MMKKFIYTIAVGLTVAIGTAGCVHRPYGVTPIPHRPTEVADANPYGTYQQQQPPVIISAPPTTERPLAENPDDINNYVQDPHALAAYTIHFSYDSPVIRDSEKAKLQQVAAALQADGTAKLRIEGNCDERGTEEYNRSLGERRAEAAREALAGMGISQDRIQTISYGKDKPVTASHDSASMSLNRRDDFVLLHRKAGA